MSIQSLGNNPAIIAQSAAQQPAVQADATAANTAAAQPETTITEIPPAENTPEALQQALEDVRSALRPVANELMFSIDDDTGRTLVKIVDMETDEVIKQIPSEEMLRIAKALGKLQGLLVKQEV